MSKPVFGQRPCADFDAPTRICSLCPTSPFCEEIRGKKSSPVQKGLTHSERGQYLSGKELIASSVHVLMLPMKASTLVRKIEKAGGRFELRYGSVYALKVPSRYRSELSKMRYLVLALIREREATIRWEASGRNPTWWRHEGPRELPFAPREQIWQALKRLLAVGSISANDSTAWRDRLPPSERE